MFSDELGALRDQNEDSFTTHTSDKARSPSSALGDNGLGSEKSDSPKSPFTTSSSSDKTPENKSLDSPKSPSSTPTMSSSSDKTPTSHSEKTPGSVESFATAARLDPPSESSQQGSYFGNLLNDFDYLMSSSPDDSVPKVAGGGGTHEDIEGEAVSATEETDNEDSFIL